MYVAFWKKKIILWIKLFNYDTSFFRDIRQTPFGEQLKLLQTLGDRLPDESVNQLLSFAHTLVTDESHNLGLLDFPIENLPAVVKMLNNAPNVPLYDAVNRLYPYKTFLPNEGSLSVEGTLQTFQVAKSGSVLSKIMHGGGLKIWEKSAILGNLYGFFAPFKGLKCQKNLKFW